MKTEDHLLRMARFQARMMDLRAQVAQAAQMRNALAHYQQVPTLGPGEAMRNAQALAHHHYSQALMNQQRVQFDKYSLQAIANMHSEQFTKNVEENLRIVNEAARRMREDHFLRRLEAARAHRGPTLKERWKAIERRIVEWIRR